MFRQKTATDCYGPLVKKPCTLCMYNSTHTYICVCSVCGREREALPRQNITETAKERDRKGGLKWGYPMKILNVGILYKTDHRKKLDRKMTESVQKVLTRILRLFPKMDQIGDIVEILEKSSDWRMKTRSDRKSPNTGNSRRTPGILQAWISSTPNEETALSMRG